MIRYAEAVLEGHPDKFCDLVADRIVEEAYAFDPEAYAQVEVSVWSDRVWLSGGVVTRDLFVTDLRDLVVEVGHRIGYTVENHIDAAHYKVKSRICLEEGDPCRWTHAVNDQAICIGWAGYDEKVHFLPPEHFLAHRFRERLTDSIRSGALRGEGPDGKLLVRLREDAGGWVLEHVLCTLQQREKTGTLDLAGRIGDVLSDAYGDCRALDARWTHPWGDVELMVNPNGPFVEGGSDGDNGQTGRKLVMDYYGPRVPIGGGALSGKDLRHIDRAGAYTARRAAVDVVQSGASTCQVTAVFAPNIDSPIDVRYEMNGRGMRPEPETFGQERMGKLVSGCRSVGELGAGGHFYDLELPWN
jgi:S-adenosylmethionine synthetase